MASQPPRAIAQEPAASLVSVLVRMNFIAKFNRLVAASAALVFVVVGTPRRVCCLVFKASAAA